MTRITKPTMVKKKKAKKAADDDEFSWSEDQEKCFQLFFRGVPKTQIAEELKKHRNTINNWCKNPAFLLRVREELEAHRNTTRLRRARTTGIITDMVSNLAVRTAKEAEKKPTKVRIRKMRELNAEFRLQRGEERIDMGDDVRRTEIVSHNAHVHQASITMKPFRDMLLESTSKGVIDATLVNADSPKEALVQAAQQLLVEGALIDAIDKEDAEAAAAEADEG